MQRQLDSADQTWTAGRQSAQRVIAAAIDSLVIHLSGDLGAGKTTWVRGFLQGLGHEGRVPSPTYTLIEPYEIAGYTISHIDLYRLQSPREVESLALPELCGSGTIMLIEWPENGDAVIPPADLRVEFDIEGHARRLRLVGSSATGKLLES